MLMNARTTISTCLILNRWFHRLMLLFRLFVSVKTSIICTYNWLRMTVFSIVAKSNGVRVKYTWNQEHMIGVYFLGEVNQFTARPNCTLVSRLSRLHQTFFSLSLIHHSTLSLLILSEIPFETLEKLIGFDREQILTETNQPNWNFRNNNKKTQSQKKHKTKNMYIYRVFK